jgi:hypothetical protein
VHVYLSAVVAAGSDAQIAQATAATTHTQTSQLAVLFAETPKQEVYLQLLSGPSTYWVAIRVCRNCARAEHDVIRAANLV